MFFEFETLCNFRFVIVLISNHAESFYNDNVKDWKRLGFFCWSCQSFRVWVHLTFNVLCLACQFVRCCKLIYKYPKISFMFWNHTWQSAKWRVLCTKFQKLIYPHWWGVVSALIHGLLHEDLLSVTGTNTVLNLVQWLRGDLHEKSL